MSGQWLVVKLLLPEGYGTLTPVFEYCMLLKVSRLYSVFDFPLILIPKTFISTWGTESLALLVLSNLTYRPSFGFVYFVGTLPWSSSRTIWSNPQLCPEQNHWDKTRGIQFPRVNMGYKVKCTREIQLLWKTLLAGFLPLSMNLRLRWLGRIRCISLISSFDLKKRRKKSLVTVKSPKEAFEHKEKKTSTHWLEIRDLTKDGEEEKRTSPKNVILRFCDELGMFGTITITSDCCDCCNSFRMQNEAYLSWN